jgi:hypothetical protein
MQSGAARCGRTRAREPSARQDRVLDLGPPPASNSRTEKARSTESVTGNPHVGEGRLQDHPSEPSGDPSPANAWAHRPRQGTPPESPREVPEAACVAAHRRRVVGRTVRGGRVVRGSVEFLQSTEIPSSATDEIDQVPGSVNRRLPTV